MWFGDRKGGVRGEEEQGRGSREALAVYRNFAGGTCGFSPVDCCGLRQGAAGRLWEILENPEPVFAAGGGFPPKRWK